MSSWRNSTVKLRILNTTNFNREKNIMKKIGKAIARKFKNWKGNTNAKGDDIEESRAHCH